MLGGQWISGQFGLHNKTLSQKEWGRRDEKQWGYRNGEIKGYDTESIFRLMSINKPNILHLLGTFYSDINLGLYFLLHTEYVVSTLV